MSGADRRQHWQRARLTSSGPQVRVCGSSSCLPSGLQLRSNFGGRCCPPGPDSADPGNTQCDARPGCDPRMPHWRSNRSFSSFVIFVSDLTVASALPNSFSRLMLLILTMAEAFALKEPHALTDMALRRLSSPVGQRIGAVQSLPSWRPKVQLWWEIDPFEKRIGEYGGGTPNHRSRAR